MARRGPASRAANAPGVAARIKGLVCLACHFCWATAVEFQKPKPLVILGLLFALVACLIGCADRSPNRSPLPAGNRDQVKAPQVTSDTPADSLAAERLGLDPALDNDSNVAAGPANSKPDESPPPLDTVAKVRSEPLEAAARLLQSFPGSPEAAAVMALTQARFGTTAEAEVSWKKCLDLDQAFVDAHHALGDIFLEKGEYGQAIQHYRRALQFDPNRTDARHRLAEALTGDGKMAEAVELLEDQIKQAPGDAETYFWLGQACLQLGDYEKAVKYHQASIGLDPGNTYSYYGLATACTRLGRKEEARKYLEEFRRLKAEDQQAELERMNHADDYRSTAQSAAFLWSAMAEVYAREGDLNSAEQFWRKAGELHPADVFSREKLASLFSKQQRLGDAIEVVKELCRLRPEGESSFLTLGVLYARQGNFEATEDSFLKAIRVAPQSAAGHAALARLYVQAGKQPADAVQHARKAVELQPVAPHYMILAEAAARSGDLAQAREAVRKAMDLDPSNAAYQRAYESLSGEVTP